MPEFDGLAKREREILRIVYRLGEASARQVQEALADGTGYSAVRTFLANLEAKGRVRHRADGIAYLWSPAGEAEREGAEAIAAATDTFFAGSRERAISALLGACDSPLGEDEYRRLRDLIDQARDRGRFDA
jgi:predicted transcriptional regulator